MLKRLAVSAALAFAVLTVPASAQEGSTQGFNTVTPSGDSVAAECYQPGSTVTFVFTITGGGTQTVTAVAGNDFVATVTRPANAESVTVTGPSCVNGVEFTQVAVLGASQVPAAAGGTALPRTGSDSSIPLAQIGLGLVAAGGAVVYGVRRRQLAGASASN